MKIVIKKEYDVALRMPTFNVDHDLNEKMVEPLNKLINKYSFVVFSGKPKSGKTSLLLSFFNKNPKVFRKCFNYIYVVMKPFSRKSVNNLIFSRLPEDQIYDTLDEETINDLYSRIEENSMNGESSCVVMDDVAKDLKKSSYIQSMLGKLVYNRRHLHLMILCTVQSVMNMPKDVRKVVNVIFQFKPAKREFEDFVNEFLEMRKQDAIKLMTYIYDKPHTFMILEVESQKIFKNFTQLKISDDNSIDAKNTTKEESSKTQKNSSQT